MSYGSPFPILFLTSYFPFLLLGGFVLPIICFFMSRNDEKRSGRIQYSGKSLVLFTLMNSAAWLFFLGLSMALVTIVMPGRSPAAWIPLRMGLIMMISGAVSLKILGALWTSLTNTNSWLPRGNMFVKCYSGMNLFILFAGFISLVSFVLYSLLEVMVGVSDWSSFREPVKVSMALAVTSGIFLYVNLKVFFGADDEIVPFGSEVER